MNLADVGVSQTIINREYGDSKRELAMLGRYWNWFKKLELGWQMDSD